MRLLARRMRETGREYALRNLKDNIIHLELKPGSMVSENELAAQMGLSRTPVREALMELSKVRLVDVYPQRGSAVALIDYDLVEEARFMRDVLEGAVVELDCDMLTEDALARLRENIALQRHHLADGAMERLWSLDNAFHSLLFQIARKEQTYQMMTGFTAHFDRVRNMSLVTVKNSKIVDDHALIVDALAARDKAAVRHLMAHHLSRYKVDEAALRAHYPAEYFKQAKYGMYIRMALILTVINGDGASQPLMKGRVHKHIDCSNPNCITHHEKYLPHWFKGDGTTLVCEYCDERTLVE